MLQLQCRPNELQQALSYPSSGNVSTCAHTELRVELVSMLLAAGADPNEADEKGDRPMHLVSRDGELYDSGLPDHCTELDVLYRLAGTNTTSAWPFAAWVSWPS